MTQDTFSPRAGTCSRVMTDTVVSFTAVKVSLKAACEHDELTVTYMLPLYMCHYSDQCYHECTVNDSRLTHSS